MSGAPWRSRFSDSLQRDVQYAGRQLARAPLFTAVSTLSLGIGIAVAVTVFSLVNSLLFKPPPVPASDRVVEVFKRDRADNGYTGSAHADVADYLATGAFTGLAMHRELSLTLVANDFPPARLPVSVVSPDYFRVLVLPLSGRSFSADGVQPEIVISHAYSRRTFGRGAKAIGATVRVNGQPFTVIGVTPKSFHGVDPFSTTAAWIARPASASVNAGLTTEAADRSDPWWGVVGRLANGVTAKAAAERLNHTARILGDRYPRAWRDFAGAPLRVSVMTPRDKIRNLAGPDLRLMLATLSAIVAVVLILACTNVAGLLLARAVTRRHEIAVRLAHGASRSRLFAQFLTESMLLALLGGAAGLVLAEAAMRLIGRSPLFESFNLSPDWRVFAAAAFASVCCAILFGLTPTMHALGADLRSGLPGHRAEAERGGVRARLMALQVCLAFLLIVLGVTASRGIRSQLRTSPGFDVNGLLVAEIGNRGADTAAARAHRETALALTRAIAGVSHAIVTERVPMEGFARQNTTITAGARTVHVGVETVQPEFFETLRLDLLHGRLPREDDGSEGRALAIVNRATAEALGHDVTGITLTLDGGAQLLVTASWRTFASGTWRRREGHTCTYCAVPAHPQVACSTLSRARTAALNPPSSPS